MTVVAVGLAAGVVIATGMQTGIEIAIGTERGIVTETATATATETEIVVEIVVIGSGIEVESAEIGIGIGTGTGIESVNETTETGTETDMTVAVIEAHLFVGTGEMEAVIGGDQEAPRLESKWIMETCINIYTLSYNMNGSSEPYCVLKKSSSIRFHYIGSTVSGPCHVNAPTAI